MVTMKLTYQEWNRYSVCPNASTKLNILQNEQRLWQLNGYGYVHSVATLTYLNITPDGPYVDPLYLGAFFHNTYKQSISRMNEMNMWHSTNFLPPLPPLKRRILGRPTMKGIRDASERSRKHMVSKEGKNVSCGICKKEGHNKTTCTQVPTPPKTNVTKKQKIMQTQESVNMQGGGEDVVMGDAVEPQAEEVMRVNESEQVVRVNEDEKLGRINQVVGHVYTTGQPSKRKKSERNLKLNLSKGVEGEVSSVRSPMELD
ncbi:unnamed protein product [Lactuca saligna]|uniref:Uncharacterized protein n=1 Tax=Lactuca saligna TaxID=75948 RepID=A0AA35Z410_LACSI|nr:unnamed protein product [Lactuca saligna]